MILEPRVEAEQRAEAVAADRLTSACSGRGDSVGSLLGRPRSEVVRPPPLNVGR